MPINVRNAEGNIVNYSCEMYGATTNFQENNTQDLVVIRFADVLLMGAESVSYTHLTLPTIA